jgi:hypothetical protein
LDFYSAFNPNGAAITNRCYNFRSASGNFSSSTYWNCLEKTSTSTATAYFIFLNH